MGSDAFLERLVNGPAVLFLGQAYMRQDSDVDALLSAIARKFGVVQDEFSYQALLDLPNLNTDRAACIAWIAETADSIEVPPWLAIAAKWHWNSVFSSAIDTAWIRAMRTPWRHVQPVLSHKYMSADQRSRLRLHCNALFGSLTGSDPDQVAPCNRAEFRRRQLIADAMALQLPELVTPFGTLAIEGYDCATDWYSADRLDALLSMFGPAQVHVFSCDRFHFSLPDGSQNIESGRVVLHGESLASVLQAAYAAGYVGPEHYDDGDAQHRIACGATTLPVPTALWNEVSQFAEILPVIRTPETLSREVLREEYRAFLGAGDSDPSWEWYARSFPLRREFEEELERTAVAVLANRRVEPRPLVLHGQTGTGKTVALNSLGFRLSRAGRCPVVMIRGEMRGTDGATLARFCEWAEGLGARETLIIWDGMRKVEEYSDLAAQLANLGRRALIVGSHYYLDASKRWKGIKYVEAPADLQPPEVKALHDALERFLALPISGARPPEHEVDCLSALYRLLPPARPRIRSGVAVEVRASEDELRRRLKELGVEGATGVAVADALLDAGVITLEDLRRSPRTAPRGSAEAVSLAHRLIGYVMVPGQYKLRLPLDLLLRAVGGAALQEVPSVLDDLDIFRWYDDPPDSGNYVIGPRSVTEATLCVRTRLGSAASEIDFVVELLAGVKPGTGGMDSQEVEFAVSLLRELGPNGAASDRYAAHYLRLADAAAKLGRFGGQENPRLLLQEAVLRREWVKQFTDQMSEEAKEGALEQASTALSLASNAAKQRNRALRVMIEVEAGALHGAWHMELRKAGKSADALRRQINDLLEHVDRARSLDPMSFYPVDVLTWGVIDALEADTLPPDQAGELLAYMLGAFDTIEPKALPAGQAEQCAKRSADVAIFLRDANWLKRSLDALEEMGSAAGVYLIARRLLGKLPSRYPASAEQLDAIHRTRLYLEAHSTTWKHDARCALLHLKLWWLEKVGVPWFYSERMVVPFERERWAECYELLERLADIQTKGGSAEPSPTVQYLTGIALFHLGAYAPGSEQFERLASVSDLVLGKHRIVRYYLLGTADGSPVTFDGTVARVLPDGRKGLIELKGMGRAIPFFVRDFGREVRPGETLGDVNVAFNHLGPLAEQSYRYRKPAEQDVYSDRND